MPHFLINSKLTAIPGESGLVDLEVKFSVTMTPTKAKELAEILQDDEKRADLFAVHVSAHFFTLIGFWMACTKQADIHAVRLAGVLRKAAEELQNR